MMQNNGTQGIRQVLLRSFNPSRATGRALFLYYRRMRSCAPLRILVPFHTHPGNAASRAPTERTAPCVLIFANGFRGQSRSH
ncbi:hypothetical protein SprV_0301209900 [Sparganum proliferum]